jgi:hypothetical protein
MTDSTVHKIRLLLAGLVLAGLGAGAYYLWSSNGEIARGTVEQAETAMLAAKEKAVEAGAPAIARTKFARGLAAERRANHLRREADYEAAAGALQGATRHYRSARTLADSLAVVARRLNSSSADSLAVTPEQFASARQAADSLRQRMLVMKEAAEQAQADSLAPIIYEQALTLSNDGRQIYEQDDYRAYTEARAKFDRASDLFESAEQVATDRHAADTRRATVNELRDKIDDNRLSPRVAELVQRADSLRTEAENAYASEDFSYAANLLKTSGRAYMRARTLHDSLQQNQERALARTRDRASADESRRTMESARSEIPRIQRKQQLYKRAQSIERTARRLYQREKYAKAAEQFSRAAEQYRAIQEMSIPLDQARNVVHELVGRYQQALEEKNIYQLQDLIPSIDGHWWSSFFENASNVRATVDAGSLERTRTGATVTIRVSIDYMDEKNRMEHETFRSVWTLKPDNGDWMITSASMR